MRRPLPLRCVLFGHRWGAWTNDADVGLDERLCRRRGCPGYDNRDDGSGFVERHRRIETVARLYAARTIHGADLPGNR